MRWGHSVCRVKASHGFMVRDSTESGLAFTRDPREPDSQHHDSWGGRNLTPRKEGQTHPLPLPRGHQRSPWGNSGKTGRAGLQPATPLDSSPDADTRSDPFATRSKNSPCATPVVRLWGSGERRYISFSLKANKTGSELTPLPLYWRLAALQPRALCISSDGAKNMKVYAWVSNCRHRI